MQENKLSPRLFWFADRVRQGILFADIGTDHAKLPVFLMKSGKISKAIAADIGEGPIARARTHIRMCGCADRIETVIADGLCGLDITAPADIAICGMGGETIRNIIDSAPAVKNEQIRLLLQPMTDFTLLREYLAVNGFSPLEEDIVASEGRMYQCMIVSYKGEPYALTPAEAELGKLCIEKRSNTFIQYVQRRRNIIRKCIDGKSVSGADISEETALITAYDEILKGEI